MRNAALPRSQPLAIGNTNRDNVCLKYTYDHSVSIYGIGPLIPL